MNIAGASLTTTPALCGRILGDDGIAEGSEPVDLDFGDIARFEPDGGLARHADPRRSAGENQITGLEREDLGQVCDELVDAEDKLACVRV